MRESLRHETPTRVELVGLRRCETRFVFPIALCFKNVTEPETKSNWWVTPDAAGRKPDSRTAPPAAGNGGAFGLSPTKSVQCASDGTTPHALLNR